MTLDGATRHQADLRAGETVAAVATGGVRSDIIQVAKAFGAPAIAAIDVKAEKLKAARRLWVTRTASLDEMLRRLGVDADLGDYAQVRVAA